MISSENRFTLFGIMLHARAAADRNQNISSTKDGDATEARLIPPPCGQPDAGRRAAEAGQPKPTFLKARLIQEPLSSDGSKPPPFTSR